MEARKNLRAMGWVPMRAGTCPICDKQYQRYPRPRHKTRHHIYLKRWYRGSTLVAYVCRTCHDEFHILFNAVNYRWTKQECVLYWKAFCRVKGKDPDKIYPVLKDIQK